MGVTEPPPLPRPGPWALLRQLRLPCDRRLSHRSRVAPRCWGPLCGSPRCGCATRAVSSGGTSGRSRFLAVMSAAVTSPSLSPGAARLVGETGAYERDRCPTGRRALPACLGVPAVPGPRQPSPGSSLSPPGRCAEGLLPRYSHIWSLLRPSVSRVASAAHASPL